jgi:hypothetical protein
LIGARRTDQITLARSRPHSIPQCHARVRALVPSNMPRITDVGHFHIRPGSAHVATGRNITTAEMAHNVYVFPANKTLTMTGTLINDGETLQYLIGAVIVAILIGRNRLLYAMANRPLSGVKRTTTRRVALRA